MIKHKAKSISNVLKLLIVAFIFFEYHYQSIIKQYHYQSIIKQNPLTSDDCKGLLFIAIAGFFILFPIDASIFIQNMYKAKNIKNKLDQEN